MYTCFRCGYHSDYKKNLVRHLSRKKICFPKLESITIEDVKIRNELEESSEIPHFPTSFRNSPQKSTQEIFHCEYCKREFNRIDSLKRHIEKSCKEKNRQDKKIQEEVSLLKEELKRKEEESKKREEESKKGKNFYLILLMTRHKNSKKKKK